MRGHGKNIVLIWRATFCIEIEKLTFRSRRLLLPCGPMRRKVLKFEVEDSGDALQDMKGCAQSIRFLNLFYEF